MNGTTRAMLAILACVGIVSMLYFLALAAAMPIWAILLLACGAFIILWTYLRFLNGRQEPPPLRWLSLMMLAAGITAITTRSLPLAEPWGGWDAWGIWNYHARFLTDGERWTNLFQSVQYDHPDYPLGLPAVIGLMTRLCGGQGLLTFSFALSFFIMLLIPAIIFVALENQNLWMACGTLLLFALDTLFMRNGVSQCADTALAAFFLTTIICLQASKADRRMLLPGAFFALSCGWMKNEGLVLGILAMLFYARGFASRYGLKCLLTGGALPLLSLVIFKVVYAPANDLFINSHSAAKQLLDAHRYTVVWGSLYQITKAHFLPLCGVAAVYAAMCVWRRRLPGKAMLLMICCYVCYFFVYILTPYALEWHLQTSHDRLLLQLAPAMLYVAANGLSGIRFARFRKQSL